MKYSGENPIEMALYDQITLDVESDCQVTVKSLNDRYVTVIGDLKIMGKDVGGGEIEISNGHETERIQVNVRLFKEPTLDFGCPQDEILGRYGTPTHNVCDTFLIYGDYSNDDMFVSHACTQMNYLFSKSLKYIESQVYIIKSVNVLLEEYLSEGYMPSDTVEVGTDSVFYFYKKKTDHDIICERYNGANLWGDTWLRYYTTAGRPGS